MLPPRLTIFALTVVTAIVAIVTHQDAVPLVVLPILIGLLVASADRLLHEPQAAAETARELRALARRARGSDEDADRPRSRPRQPVERTMLIVATTCLLSIGALMVWSASARPGAPYYADNPRIYLTRYLVFGACALPLAWLLSRRGVAVLRRLSTAILAGSIVLLVLVLVPGVGVTVDGAHRWLGSSLSFEPAELAKLSLVLFAAGFLAEHPRRVKRFKTAANPVMVVTGGAAVLVALQPDLGTALMMCVVVAAILVAAGMPLRYLGYMSFGGIVLTGLLVLVEPYQQPRLFEFLNPWEHAYSSGFQSVQGQIALGSGGLFGVGIGNSIQKAFYLPQANSDFILAILGEELGASGVLIVMALFSTIALAGLRIARAASDLYDTLLATGLTALIVCQAAFNMFVVLGLAPLTGVALPFISYSPGNLVVTLAAVGLLLDVQRRNAVRAAPVAGHAATRRIGIVDQRVGLLFLTIVAALGVAALREMWITTGRAGELHQIAARQQVRTLLVPARRGTILDRHRFALAASRRASDIAVSPRLIGDPQRVAARLAPLLGRPAEQLANVLDGHERFAYLARQVPTSVGEQVRRLAEYGVYVFATMRRVHPRGPVAPQLLGDVDADRHGSSGLELMLDAVLAGHDGVRRIVSNALGDAISSQEREPVRSGDSVQLTIDAGLQADVAAVLARIGAAAQPRSATAVVLSTSTGDVLAMATWPSPEALAPGSPTADRATASGAVATTYEPGSAFGVLTVAAALQEGLVRPDELLHVPSSLEVDERVTIASTDQHSADLTTGQIVAQGSDIGTILIGLRLGAARFDTSMRRFGFGRKSGVDLPDEAAGNLPRLDDQAVSAMGSLPIGEGESVTPLQMAAAYAALANGGVLRTPRIVARTGRDENPRPPGRKVLSAENAAAVRGMLPPGSGTASATPLVDPATGLHSPTRLVSSFAGIAPPRDPAIALVVVVEEPRTGTDVAAEASRAIERFALPYLGLPASGGP